jgi:hypothetical protein
MKHEVCFQILLFQTLTVRRDDPIFRLLTAAEIDENPKAINPVIGKQRGLNSRTELSCSTSLLILLGH